MRARARLLLWAPVTLLLGFEFWLSAQPRQRLPSLGSWFTNGDKAEHAVYFLLTGLCAVRAARFGERWRTSKTAVFLVLAAALWGCLDEIHQSHTPGRDVEIGDVLADIAGVAIAVAFGERFLRRIGLSQTVR